MTNRLEAWNSDSADILVRSNPSFPLPLSMSINQWGVLNCLRNVTLDG